MTPTHIIHGIPITVTRKNVKYIRLRVSAEKGVQASLPRLARFSALERFVAAKAKWIEQACIYLDKRAPAPAITKAQRQAMLARLPERVAYWSGIVGVPVPDVRVRLMKTRWGSCNIPKRRIWLNAQLAAKPAECLDYVIVHELVHFHERGHNKRFYSMMDKAMPDWRQHSLNLSPCKN